MATSQRWKTWCAVPCWGCSSRGKYPFRRVRAQNMQSYSRTTTRLRRTLSYQPRPTTLRCRSFASSQNLPQLANRLGVPAVRSSLVRSSHLLGYTNPTIHSIVQLVVEAVSFLGDQVYPAWRGYLISEPRPMGQAISVRLPSMLLYTKCSASGLLGAPYIATQDIRRQYPL